MSQFSDFRKKKLLFVFKVFFDIDGSGSINNTDFQLALENVVKMRGYSKSDPKYSETENMLQDIWNELRASGDGNKDGQISSDEWCAMWYEYAQNSDKPQKWQNRYMDFIFNLQDSTGDGLIDENEFVTVCTSYGIDAAECKAAFSKFSNNNAISITRVEFAKLWKEFFTSDDTSARGNFIFGKTSFD
ncbi:UNVERIFIED_CONTAM: hypothetical protein PYX00_008761 [Menopon gallinae]|uniref:EF-hand domain-containing protein n=1 Tax=Menopon gallinae TaxID=328185 RepID=A0AAW2HQL6_9NEOP